MHTRVHSSSTHLLSTSKLHFRKWEPAEEAVLVKAYKNMGPVWPIICRQLPGRSPTQCRKHWLELEWKPRLTASSTAPISSNTKECTRAMVATPDSAKAKATSAPAFVPRPSSLFPSLSPLPPMTPQQKAEWHMMWHGYEKANGKWTVFPQDSLGPSPAQRLSADLPRTRGRRKGEAWSLDEDLVLREAFEAHGFNWEAISALLPARSADDCRTRLVFRFMTLNPISEPKATPIASVEGPQ